VFNLARRPIWRDGLADAPWSPDRSTWSTACAKPESRKNEPDPLKRTAGIPDIAPFGLPVRVARSRRLVIAICSISRWRGPHGGKRAWRCLFARTNTAKTGYSQTHGPKIMSVGEREGSKPSSVRRESAHDANKRVAKAKWSKSGVLLNNLHPEASSAVTRSLPGLVTRSRAWSRKLSQTGLAHAAVAVRHARKASSRTTSVRRDVRWRWTLKVFWTAA